MAAGLTWNLYTITLVVVLGSCAIFLILYILSLVSVPAVVFFPAYSIHFFASRYPALNALLHPAPPPMTTDDSTTDGTAAATADSRTDWVILNGLMGRAPSPAAFDG